VGESLDDREPELDRLGLGFLSTDVGDGGSSRVVGVPSRSLIMRLVVHQTSRSTTGDPPLLSIAGTPEASCSCLMPDVHQLDLATVNGVMPSGGLVKRSRSTDLFGV
jgi:hypothetical protein